MKRRVCIERANGEVDLDGRIETRNGVDVIVDSDGVPLGPEDRATHLPPSKEIDRLEMEVLGLIEDIRTGDSDIAIERATPRKLDRSEK